MRRGIQVAINALVVLLLLTPFDCFSGKKLTREAAECCKKGKCNPSNQDDCCKGTLPDGKHLVASKAQDFHAPSLDVLPAQTIPAAQPTFALQTIDLVHAPPESPPSTRLNLPLLI
jgi:hypothetical protein